jgi:hypothetical protein
MVTDDPGTPLVRAAYRRPGRPSHQLETSRVAEQPTVRPLRSARSRVCPLSRISIPWMFRLLVLAGLAGATLTACSVTVNTSDTPAPTQAQLGPSTMSPAQRVAVAKEIDRQTDNVDQCLEAGDVVSCDNVQTLEVLPFAGKDRADFSTLFDTLNALERYGPVPAVCFQPVLGVSATHCASPPRHSAAQTALAAFNQLRADFDLSALPMPSLLG